MAFKISKAQRLEVVIGISLCFFIAEISVGFYTHSLALIADAFHYLNDLLSFVVALVALKVSERQDSPQALSFGWQRAQLLGAFFNGVFLLALGISIFLQAIERFVSLQKVERPELVLIVGCVGLGLNIISAVFLHEHDHDVGPPAITTVPDSDSNELREEALNEHSDHRHKVTTKGHGHSHDLGMLSVLMHVIGDAINNIGVIIAAVVIWKAKYEGRFYADPGVSVGIAIMILLSAFPIMKRSGAVLLQSAPLGVDLEDVKHDLEKVDGIVSIHELHAWRLSQSKAVASAHVVTSADTLTKFNAQAKLINECLHAYGIHSITLQPEFTPLIAEGVGATGANAEGPSPTPSLRQRAVNAALSNVCRMNCGSLCEPLQCCK
ncbi:cation efflux system protein czcD [Tricladium varicosporioides]|nr:cation efflux system protein czcD [Hymenoscyphus varicosporioides]